MAPVVTSRPIWPLQKTKPPATMAELRMPARGAGALVVKTGVFRDEDIVFLLVGNMFKKLFVLNIRSK